LCLCGENKIMRIDIVTIFPEIFQGPFDHGIIRRARKDNLLEIAVHNLRDFTYDRHQVVDDRPFGGREGMVLKPEPLFRAIEYLTGKYTAASSSVALLTPQGEMFNQQMAARLSRLEHLLLICGRYEGIDERVTENLVTDEISIGDYVLSGGEFAAMVVVDAVTRLIPNALGCADSTENESFSSGLLDCPVYTRPAVYRGLSVPELLLGGNHQEIARWRRRKALERTLLRRPDLLDRAQLADEDLRILEGIRKEENHKNTKGTKKE
jgi:tRNA (guanine37-N1)-methyltransferase